MKTRPKCQSYFLCQFAVQIVPCLLHCNVHTHYTITPESISVQHGASVFSLMSLENVSAGICVAETCWNLSLFVALLIILQIKTCFCCAGEKKATNTKKKDVMSFYDGRRSLSSMSLSGN